jgi:AcrR family transcriptional regulator
MDLPMSTNPNSRTRKNDPVAVRSRILDAAADLFQQKGYAETSTGAIMKAAGVSAGALHHHYPTKKALGLAVIKERVATAVQSAWIDPVRNAELPAAGVRSAFTAIASELERQKFVRGCPLNNLAIELAFADADFRSALAPIFEEWRRAIAERLRRHEGEEGLSDGIPDELATLVVAAYSGAMAMAKASQSAEPLLTVMKALSPSLEAHHVA